MKSKCGIVLRKHLDVVVPHIFVWGFCFCSLTPGSSSCSSSSVAPPPTSLPQLHFHNSSHTTHLTQLIPHNFTTHLQQLHLHYFTYTTHLTAHPLAWQVQQSVHRMLLCVAGAALREPGRCLWSTASAGPHTSSHTPHLTQSHFTELNTPHH